MAPAEENLRPGAVRPNHLLLHGTCIALGGHGILLRGVSGAGKSDLALRCLHYPFNGPQGALLCQLVADDQTEIIAQGGHLLARPPPAIAGKLEVRGIGIIEQDYLTSARLELILDLPAADSDGSYASAAATIERLPPDLEFESILGVKIGVMALAPFELSAPIKVFLALQRVLSHRA